MRVMSILTARTLAFMELAELNLGSKVFLPDLVTKLNERYQFSSNNSTDKADLKEKGLLFEAGYSQAHSIKKLSFNPSLTYVEGEESTDRYLLISWNGRRKNSVPTLRHSRYRDGHS